MRWTYEELERKARGARDFPSYLSGILPTSKTHKTNQDFLRMALRVWYKTRGPVLPE